MTATEQLTPSRGRHRAEGRARLGMNYRYKDLPTWDEMSDLDKGSALLHVYRSTWSRQTRKIMNCKYTDDPALVALNEKERSRHAHHVTGGIQRITSRLGNRETSRLMKIAGYKLG